MLKIRSTAITSGCEMIESARTNTTVAFGLMTRKRAAEKAASASTCWWVAMIIGSSRFSQVWRMIPSSLAVFLIGVGFCSIPLPKSVQVHEDKIGNNRDSIKFNLGLPVLLQKSLKMCMKYTTKGSRR
mgnify:CR=1 FL=1